MVNIQDKLSSAANDVLIPFLLNIRTTYPDLISSVPPSHVSTNCDFVIDLLRLKHPKDVMSDELGAWDQTNTSRKYYNIHNSSSDCNQFSMAKKTNYDIEVTRRSYSNKSDKTLKKTMVSVANLQSDCELVYVGYKFNGPAHEVQVKAHGNSKHQTCPFSRVFKSTKELLKSQVNSWVRNRNSVTTFLKGFFLTRSIIWVEK